MMHQFKRNAGLDIYEPPKDKHDYVMTVDVARGVGEDTFTQHLLLWI